MNWSPRETGRIKFSEVSSELGVLSRMQKNAYGKGFMRDGLPDATFAGYPPNCETARRGANCPLERWIWVWDLRANGVGSAGFYSSRLGNRAHQIFRKCEK